MAVPEQRAGRYVKDVAFELDVAFGKLLQNTQLLVNESALSVLAAAESEGL